MDGSKDNEGSQGFSEVLEVRGETAVSTEPGEGALDHPSPRRDNEALHIVRPFDDLQAQDRHFGDGGFDLLVH
jgi:hypothetical protein